MSMNTCLLPEFIQIPFIYDGVSWIIALNTIDKSSGQPEISQCFLGLLIRKIGS
jgi:hypothetical protein